MGRVFRPLKFKPIYKPVLWGGNRITSFKGLESLAEPIGESWELSGLEGYESIVSTGEFEGVSIKHLLEQHGKEILGDRLYGIYGTRFPLLVKFIDAMQDLSIQVHPNDKIAMKRHNCNGKNELWYILDAIDGAVIYLGFESPITKVDLKRQIENNTICSILAKYILKRGDVFYLPAGQIHGIGAGTFLLEIQQTSDITYRVYDYDRKDLNGEKRELHIDHAIEAIDYDIHKDEYKCHVNPSLNNEVEIKRYDHFVMSLIEADKSMIVNVAEKDSFRIIVITKGEGNIDDGKGMLMPLRQGETVLIPAIADSIKIIPQKNSSIETVSVYMP